VGGIDPRVLPVQDAVLPGPNNTFYLAGGTDGKEQPLSQVWALSLSGTLSPNLPNSVSGSWAAQTIDANRLPSPSDQTGTIVGQRIVSVGSQYTRVVDALNKNSISPESCPAPRTGVSVAPNLSSSSSSFATQAFVLLGLLDTSVWDDGGGLYKGEVVSIHHHIYMMALKTLISGHPRRTSLKYRQEVGVVSFLPAVQALEM
jgi:hypothetical protein